jgi:uncharacterized protein (DUF885 family)
MNHIFKLGVFATAALIACASAHAAGAHPAAAQQATAHASANAAKANADSQRVNGLADDYWNAQARFNPIAAGEAGDSRFNDQIGMAIAPQVRARQFALYKDYVKRLHAIRRSALSPRDQTTYDILDYSLTTALRFEAFPEHLLPLDQMDSVPVDLANYASGQGAQPLVTVKDYQAYLSRLNQLGPWIDQAIANMRDGVKRGVTLPKAVMVSSLPQFQHLEANTAEASIYYTPIKNFPAGFSDADKASLRAAYRSVIADKVNPAVKRLSDFLETDYLPACRTSTGYDALPNGKAWYLARVASQTTTDLAPDDIHLIGQKEVARIQKEYARIGPQMGFSGPSTDLPTWVGEQAKYKPFKTEAEIIAVYRKLNATLNTKLPALFSLRPKTPLDIRLEPELTRATASDHYTPPAADGSRPGVFWAVVNDPTQYGSTGMTTLFLHEGQPGHHFHIALTQELGLPTLRKFDMNNAFTEGWALYAETLGTEMGLYEKPEDWFGHLNDEMLRAVRLVVDTGMHSKGWTREQSIKYMRETLGYTEALARSETERYMAWPGQALGYKIGALKIQALRARAEQALGPKFNLPAFHAVVLGEGTLPLELLEKKVNLWIAANKANK